MRIQRPGSGQEIYFSRKKVHSLNCQLIINPFCRVVDASIGHPGSMHDGRVFRCSAIYRKIQAGEVLNGPSLVFNRVQIPQVLQLLSLFLTSI